MVVCTDCVGPVYGFFCTCRGLGWGYFQDTQRVDAFERPVWPRAHTHIKEGERACLDDHHGSSDLKCMVVEFLEKKVKICQYLDSTIYKHAHTHTRTHIYIYIIILYYIYYMLLFNYAMFLSNGISWVGHACMQLEPRPSESRWFSSRTPIGQSRVHP